LVCAGHPLMEEHLLCAGAEQMEFWKELIALIVLIAFRLIPNKAR
jgi:hypothetical protein